MENQAQNIIAIGRKRIPIEEIALVEPFEPPAEPAPRFTSDKEFKTRVVLIDRYSVLTEDTVEAFAEANKFRRLPDDNVATNPAVRFRVETFEPSEGFQPRKPYQSRLKRMMRLPPGRDQRFDIGRRARHHIRLAEIAGVGQQRFDLAEPFRQASIFTSIGAICCLSLGA